MDATRGKKLKLHWFSNLNVDRGEWLASRLGSCNSPPPPPPHPKICTHEIGSLVDSSESQECLFIQLRTTALRLIVWSGLDVPTFATRRLHACHDARAPSGGRWNCGREMFGKFCLNAGFHATFRDLLHAVKLRHGTDGFTSSPKEGVLRIFSP